MPKMGQEYSIKSKLTDKEWVELVEKTVKYCHEGLRLGQSYMNALSKVNIDLYNEIIATDVDPFYNDNILPRFIEYLTNQISIDDIQKYIN